VTVPAKKFPQDLSAAGSNPVKPALVLPPGACDAHCHVSGPPPNFPMRPTEATRRRRARRESAEVACSLWEFPVPSSCMPAATGRKWMSTVDAIASSNGAYRGVACVKDSVTDGALERLHRGGIRGIRFNFVKHLGACLTSPCFTACWLESNPGWHIVLHFDADDILAQRELLGRIDVPFIIDHMGRD